MEAGTIVTASFLVTNNTNHAQNLRPLIKLPPGWISIPFHEPFFTLDPFSSKVELFALRVPKNTLAGTYHIPVLIEGMENPSILSESSFNVTIQKNSKIVAYLENCSAIGISGEAYTITLSLTNTGNIGTEIEILTEEHLGFPIYPKNTTLFVNPQESKKIAFQVETQESQETLIHNVVISLLNKLTGKSETLFHQIELFSKTPISINRYQTLPLQTVFGYGMKNGHKQLFIEQSGRGSLGKGKEIDFFVRAPLLSEANVDRDLGGLPENWYLHYFTQSTNTYIGDGVYSLTPLTILNRFGKGGSFSLQSASLKLKTLCIYDSSSIPQAIAGESLSYRPLPFLALSLSSLQTHLTPFSKKVLGSQKNTVSNSLLGELAHNKMGDHTLEYGSTNPFFSSARNSYYIYSRASPFSKTWYALQRIYAPSQFVGYYQDTSQLYTSVGFPIIKKLQGSLSYNYSAYNLEKMKKSDLNATRNRICYGGISYPFSFGLYTSLYYNYSTSKDSLQDHLGYQTHFASLNGGQSLGKWTLQGILEYGSYKNLHKVETNHRWQSAQVYAYYQPSPRAQYASYVRLGYIDLSPELNWTRTYGVSCSLYLKKNLTTTALYELTNQQRIRHYLSGNIKYTLKNKSYFELKGYLNQESSQKNTVEFLFSYTIPWNLPIRKNKSAGSIKGHVSEEKNPIQNLIVNCSGQRTLTDRKGNFTFPSLLPGDYHVWLEGTSKVTTPPLPLPVKVDGGKTTSLQIHFTHPCKLTGSFPILDELQEKTGMLKQASLCLESVDTGKKLFTQIDHLGIFSFDKLSAGRWLLKILAADLPPYYSLEKEEMVVDLFPGEEKNSK